MPKFDINDVKEFVQVQAIEKLMRRTQKDIRRYERVVKKASKNYKNTMERMEILQKSLKALESKRDLKLLNLKEKIV